MKNQAPPQPPPPKKKHHKKHVCVCLGVRGVEEENKIKIKKKEGQAHKNKNNKKHLKFMKKVFSLFTSQMAFED